MLRHAMVSDMPDDLSVQPPPSRGKLAAQLKSLLAILVTIFSLHVAFIPGCMSMFKVGKGSPGVLNSLQQKFQFEIS